MQLALPLPLAPVFFFGTDSFLMTFCACFTLTWREYWSNQEAREMTLVSFSLSCLSALSLSLFSLSSRCWESPGSGWRGRVKNRGARGRSIDLIVSMRRPNCCSTEADSSSSKGATTKLQTRFHSSASMTPASSLQRSSACPLTTHSIACWSKVEAKFLNNNNMHRLRCSKRALIWEGSIKSIQHSGKAPCDRPMYFVAPHKPSRSSWLITASNLSYASDRNCNMSTLFPAPLELLEERRDTIPE